MLLIHLFNLTVYSSLTMGTSCATHVREKSKEHMALNLKELL